MDVRNLKCLTEGMGKVVGLAEFKNGIIKMSQGLESTSLRSIKGLESTMMVNDNRHPEEFLSCRREWQQRMPTGAVIG